MQFFILNFRFWTEPQTIQYHESGALALHARSSTPKSILKNYPRGFELSKYHKLTNLDPKITKMSVNLKIKTSSPPTPYYSTEHISSTSHFDLLRQQSEKFYFTVSGWREIDF